MWYLPSWQHTLGKGKHPTSVQQHIKVSRNVYYVLDNEVDEPEEEPALPLNDTDESDDEDLLLREELELGAITLTQLQDSVDLRYANGVTPDPTNAERSWITTLISSL
eukprot:3932796-Rhodomonas_salina.1